MKKTGRSVRLLPSLFHHLDVFFWRGCIKPYIVVVQLKLEPLMNDKEICTLSIWNTECIPGICEV